MGFLQGCLIIATVLGLLLFLVRLLTSENKRESARSRTATAFYDNKQRSTYRQDTVQIPKPPNSVEERTSDCHQRSSSTYRQYTVQIPKPPYSIDERVSDRHQRPWQKHRQLVLAVDATPRRVGALLKRTHDKQIWYYSFDWSRDFYFPLEPYYQEPDKLELTNAILAITLFGSIIQECSHLYKKVIVKLDNSVIKAEQILPNDILRSKAWALVGDIQGDWKYVLRTNDTDMCVADKLSRQAVKEDNLALGNTYHGYRIKDCTEFISDDILDSIKLFVPQRFLYDDNSDNYEYSDDQDQQLEYSYYTDDQEELEDYGCETYDPDDDDDYSEYYDYYYD